MTQISLANIEHYATENHVRLEWVQHAVLIEAFIRRACIVDGPFALKGSAVTRQFLNSLELNARQRLMQDIDWLCLAPFSVEHSRSALNEWADAVTRIYLDDGVQFRSFAETQLWRMIDYAMDRDFPTVNTDLVATIAGQQFQVNIDVSFNVMIVPAPVPLAYVPLFGESFVVPRTPPLAQQIAWKLHQSIVRPRFKDLLDLTMLLRHNVVDADAVRDALLCECGQDGANPVQLKRLLDVSTPNTVGLKGHPAYRFPVTQLWNYWRHEQVADGANAQDMSLRLNESLASECVANADALPSELGEFCRNLADALRSSGLADWIAELPGDLEKPIGESRERSLPTAWSVAAKWLGFRR